MMNMYGQLTKLILVNSFGQGSKRPLLSSLARLLLSILLALFLGLVIANGVKKTNLPADLPDLLLTSLLTVSSFVISGFILLSVSNINLQKTNFAQQIRLFPLKRNIRWLISVTPLIVILLVISFFAIPLVIVLANQMEVSVFSFIGYMILGFLSALGFCLIKIPKLTNFKSVLFVLINLLIFALLDLSLKSGNPGTQNSLWLIAVILINLNIFGVIQSFFINHRLTAYQSNKYQFTLSSGKVNKGWFIVKILRNRRTYNTFLFCLAFTLVLVSVNYFKHQTDLVGTGLIVISAFIVCSFASDIRGLSRRFNAPEVISLKGSQYFIDNEIGSVLLLGGIIIFPVYALSIFASSLGLMNLSIYTLSVVLSACLIGILSGTIFVPQAGDFGSQFFSAMTATSMFLLLPRILKFSNQSMVVQSLYWLMVAACCYLFVIIIERQRRRNYGHA